MVSPLPATVAARLASGARALVALVVADLAIRILPFDLVAARIRSLPDRRGRSADAVAVVATTRWALAAALRRIPWTIRCLARAVAANRLLARSQVPSRLWLGVGWDRESALEAHAWLEAEGTVVTGRREKSRFTPLCSLGNGGDVRESVSCSRS